MGEGVGGAVAVILVLVLVACVGGAGCGGGVHASFVVVHPPRRFVCLAVCGWGVFDGSEGQVCEVWETESGSAVRGATAAVVEIGTAGLGFAAIFGAFVDGAGAGVLGRDAAGQAWTGGIRLLRREV